MRNLFFLLFLLSTSIVFSQNFDTYFVDKTLRVDCIFAGNTISKTIVVDELNKLPQWAGRKHNLTENHLQGEGQISMYDLKSGQLIYTNSFSSLFQEWLSTDEAKDKSKSFENVFLLPFPKEKVKVEIALFDINRNREILLKHIVDPTDILIHKRGYKNIVPHSLIHKATYKGNSINVAIVAEGFQKAQMEEFRKYANIAVEQIFAHQPFGEYKDRFNFYVVESESKDKGVSVPRRGDWKSTAVSSHFDTFYSARYLTTSRVKKIHDLLAGIPYEHIIILANTNVYGGGGIFNAYTLTTTGHSDFKPVVVHEFGHSFAGLADEYFYENDVLNGMQTAAVEPWEQNITTLVDFESKWKDMLSPGTPIPTEFKDRKKYPIGVYEGLAGNKIYKPAIDCRMNTNLAKSFCPVCQRAIGNLIKFYTE